MPRHAGAMTTHTTSERIEDELVRRLMHQRIIVLGEELGERNGNRLMHQLLLWLLGMTFEFVPPVMP